MKRLFYILAILPLILTSCTKDPYSDFVASTLVAEVGEPVYFTNRSQDANSYEWDFDDGYYSTTFNASHSWGTAGNYQVALSAFGKDGRIDISLTDISVRYLTNTNLEITVEEYEEPYYLVADISVRLYPSIADWEDETNMLAEGFTDANGVVLFPNVPIPYARRLYVDVWGPYHENYQLAAEDAGWIETDVLAPNVWNYFTAVVDYYPDGKKAAISRKDLKEIEKQEAIGKDARIPSERENIDKGHQTVR
ncbi:MAG: PKD domain-containing protein [Bacteroidales bacterium]|nr:PKD domain-containing protein [Bacteroidales bacterium]